MDNLTHFENICQNRFMSRWLIVDVVFILFLLWAYNAHACGDQETETITINVNEAI